MSTHTQLGTISVPVGSYLKAGETKTSFRPIGVLMKSTDDRGERYWLRLNADILHASLYALISRADMEKGEDTFTARVFEPRDPAKAAAKPAGDAPAAEEDRPF